MTYAIINSENLVVNVIEWDGESDWQPPENHQVVLLTEGGMGWSYINGVFVPPS
jgi:hypothetical protein